MTNPILVCDLHETSWYGNFVIVPSYVAKTHEEAIEVIYRQILDEIPEFSSITEDYDTLEYGDEDYPASFDSQITYVLKVTLDWLDDNKVVPHCRRDWFLVEVKWSA